ncbi:MAG TPA: regulatory protein RecX [Chitinophagaceae bacterium]|nr:regulatory protein RecX [Chitinophagaceae bacterium]
MNKKKLTKDEALQKLRHYCAYQERCHKEVKDKLYGFGLNKNDVEEAIAVLIEENYLNEERYAIAFAGGYFRSKQWGRVKIGYELKSKGISQYCINVGMKEISEDDYIKTIRDLIDKKRASIADESLNTFARNQKIVNYLLQRGFESQLVQRELKAED